MRVDRLALQDFRGIRHLELQFPGQVTVLAGVNGSGKSTVLQALATLLWRVGAGLRAPAREQGGLQAGDVRNGAKGAMLELSVSGALGEIGWRMEFQRTLSRVTRRLHSEHLKSAIGELTEQLQADPSTPVPFAAFYRTNRAVLDIPLRIKKKHVFDQFAAFDEALDGGWSSFRLFFEWFREREDLENEQRARSQRHRDHVLEAVRAAIAALMPGFKDLRVQRQPLSMRITKGDEDLDIAQLSDGEKCLLAMVADIARRLALANPAEQQPCKATAVVLIDEIELHLHPRWQREVLPALQRTFPNCQFIVSTHSPQVLASVQAEHVYLLERKDGSIEARRPNVSFGRETNEILLELMDTPARPADIRRRLDAMFACIDAGDLTGAQAARAALEREIGADEPEFVRADMLLRLRRTGR